MDLRDVSPVKLPDWLSPKMIVIAVIVVAVMVFSSTGFYVVDQTEEGVLLTFGKFTAITQPGLQFKLPLGIQQNFNVPTKVVQTEQFGFRTSKPGINTEFVQGDFSKESTMLTGDLNIVDLEWIIQYRITDAKAWSFNVMDRHRTIRDISQSVINMLVGDRTILDVIGPQRTMIEEKGAELMNQTLSKYELGINIIAVRLQNIVPPKGVQEAFEDVNKAIQDMNRLINEGKEQYNQVIPRARGQSDQLIQIAQGYASERVNKARGDVARFNSVYEEYRKSPDVTRERLYYEMIETVFGSGTQAILVDKKLENFLPIMNMGTGTGVKSGAEVVK